MLTSNPFTLEDFEDLFRKNFNKLCQKAYSMTKDADTAKDIVQEVFIKFWNMGENAAEIAAKESYLYRAVINQTLNYLTSQQKKIKQASTDNFAIVDTQQNTENQELELEELQQKLHNAIETLPPMCKKVFLLSRYEEMSHKEIAAFLDISPNTVDNHIKKALGILRQIVVLSLLVFIYISQLYF